MGTPQGPGWRQRLRHASPLLVLTAVAGVAWSMPPIAAWAFSGGSDNKIDKPPSSDKPNTPPAKPGNQPPTNLPATIPPVAGLLSAYAFPSTGGAGSGSISGGGGSGGGIGGGSNHADPSRGRANLNHQRDNAPTAAGTGIGSARSVVDGGYRRFSGEQHPTPPATPTGPQLVGRGTYPVTTGSLPRSPATSGSTLDVSDRNTRVEPKYVGPARPFGGARSAFQPGYMRPSFVGRGWHAAGNFSGRGGGGRRR